MILRRRRRSAVPEALRAPAYAGDFPDPAVLVVGSAYWAYATGSAGRNLQVMRSTDLRSWSPPADPLPVLPGWASPGHTWAPGVILMGDGYLLYYTVRHTALGLQCISVATADRPGGPFVDRSAGPLVFQHADGGSIDPEPFLDPDSGRLHLVWKSDDNAIGRPTRLWVQPLSPSGLETEPGTRPTLLLGQSARWQVPRMEGPTVLGPVPLPDEDRYLLFYGANRYESASSGIGYATGASLVGPFTDRSTGGPWLATTGRARGPQGPMVFTDLEDVTRLAFAAWTGAVGYHNGGVRSLWIGALEVGGDGVPRLT